METEFPKTDINGFLPYSFSEHQLMTSMDYHPKSEIATFIFGGFNCHAAHHLFPNLPHTIYPVISPVVQKVALDYNYRYNVLSLYGAIKSHFLFLRKLGV
jgi:linoleoyl-CoA desaturase